MSNTFSPVLQKSSSALIPLIPVGVEDAVVRANFTAAFFPVILKVNEPVIATLSTVTVAGVAGEVSAVNGLCYGRDDAQQPCCHQ